FNPGRKSRQLERLLHLFKHAFHVGLQDAKALFESELGIFLNEIDHVALFAALRREDMDAAAPSLTENLFQQLEIVQVDRHVDLARQKRRRTRIRTVKV